MGKILLALCLGYSAFRCEAREIMVFAAASLTESLNDVARAYEKSSGDKVVINFGASSTLARQIEEGAPADIFFSADEAQMNRLEKQQLIVPGTRQNRLSNSLVIIVSAQDGATIHSPKDLVAPQIKRIALGDPKTVPIGVYARSFLEKAGLWSQVASKVVPTENVRGALSAVESGDAQASIVYQTDALISTNVVVACHVPREQVPEIHYPIALLRGARGPEPSKRFLQFLAGNAATRVFEKRGFIVIQ